MPNEKKNDKKVTLRQRMRLDAEPKLDALIHDARLAVNKVAKGTPIGPGLLMQLAASPLDHKTLRHKLVTLLANAAERELEELYNRQVAMNLEGDDAKAK